MLKIKVLIGVSLCLLIFGNVCANNNTYSNKNFAIAILYPKDLKPTTNFKTTYFLRSDDVDGRHKIVEIPIIDYHQDMKPYYYAAVRISASSKTEDIEKCYANSQATKMINGVKFRVLSIKDAGMSQYLNGISYRVKHHGMCYAIEFLTSGASSAAYANSIAEMKAMDKEIKQKNIRAKKIAATIIRTFRFYN